MAIALKKNTALSDMRNIQSRSVWLPPGSRTQAHCHHDIEIWHILSGEAKIILEEEEIQLKNGESFYFQPLQLHAIENCSRKIPLHFISLWWNDLHALNQILAYPPLRHLPTHKKIIILPSFPTPNGKLHLGHLAGPYISADIYKRYQQLQGNSALLLLGTIGHQSQVAWQSSVQNASFREVAEKYSCNIKESLFGMHILPDIFLSPSQAKDYSRITQDFFTRLYKKGYIKWQEKDALFCENCQKYCFEVHALGKCPFCLENGAGSNECENCAIIHEDKDLLNPHCLSCGQELLLRPLFRYYFSLERFREKLQTYYQQIDMSPRLCVFLEKIFKNTLLDIPLTQTEDYGIPVPVDDCQQRLYSLFELPARYIAVIQEYLDQNRQPETWEALLQSHSTVLFFGFDNAFLRCIIFPALLMAYKSSLPLPQTLVSNEFYLLENKKFSTSRNHAIAAEELLENYSADLIRFYLASTQPEQSSTNFSLEHFKVFIHSQLMPLEKCLQSLGHCLRDHYEKLIPAPGLWDEKSTRFYEELHYLHHKINTGYQSSILSLSSLCHDLLTLMKRVNEFSTVRGLLISLDHFKDQVRTYLALELMAARSLSLLLSPIMPTFAKELWIQLGNQQTETFDSPQTLAWLPSGQKIRNLENISLDTSSCAF